MLLFSSLLIQSIYQCYSLQNNFGFFLDEEEGWNIVLISLCLLSPFSFSKSGLFVLLLIDEANDNGPPCNLSLTRNFFVSSWWQGTQSVRMFPSPQEPPPSQGNRKNIFFSLDF